MFRRPLDHEIRRRLPGAGELGADAAIVGHQGAVARWQVLADGGPEAAERIQAFVTRARQRLIGAGLSLALSARDRTTNVPQIGSRTSGTAVGGSIVPRRPSTTW